MPSLAAREKCTRLLRVLFAPVVVTLEHQSLILRLARRDLESRYRGAVFGLAWTVIQPLLMLTVYTFIFSVVFKARWGSDGTGGIAEFALYLFSGLLLFNVFADCISRAPGLILENVSYIKKVVFPLEILPLVVLFVALVNAAIGFVILLVFSLVEQGLPPWTIVLLPLVLLPLCLFTLGLAWFLSAVGVFVRDLRQIVTVLVTVMMFLSPIFYPLSALPAEFRDIIFLNPLTMLLEYSKMVLFQGVVPPLGEWMLYTFISLVWSGLGFAWFMKTRRGFADVV